MKVKKISEHGVIPTKAYHGDAGFDVYAPADVSVPAGMRTQVPLGIAIEINEDEVCVVSERSGQAIKHGMTTIGNIIDSGYRGEISVIIHNLGDDEYLAKKGDKIGQLIIHKLGDQSLEVVAELSESARGSNAHYSSGK